MKPPKLVTIVFVIGLAFAMGPWIFLENPSRYWYVATILGLGAASIAGYNAQARMIGLGEPGEELLQKGWRWFKYRVLRRPVESESTGDAVKQPHHSMPHKPERSALSRGVFITGVALAAIPILLGAAIENKVAYTFVGIGCVLMMIARRNIPPDGPADPPHGRELLQVWWAWLFRGGRK